MIKYKYRLFETAADLEIKISESVATNKDKRKYQEIIENIYINGWRNEYDLWFQTLKD